MIPSNESSIQDRVNEELGLLPGRLSRTFYLMATLDAQAKYVHDNVQNTRCQIFEKLNAAEGTAAVTMADLQDLALMRQMHETEHNLLADKLEVGNKGSEWVERAKNVVKRYRQDYGANRRLARERRLRSSQSSSNAGDYDRRRAGGTGSTDATAEVEGRNRKRFTVGGGSPSLLDDEDDGEDSRFALYGFVGGDSTSETTGVGPPKRRRISASGDYSNAGISHRRSDRSHRGIVSSLSRKSTGSRISTNEVNGHPKLTSSNIASPATAKLPAVTPSGTFTIKLGSQQQKGRPRKPESIVPDASVTDQPTPQVLNEIEEYFCPICNKSDFQDPTMVACDSCDRWYHCSCVGFSLDDAQKSINFYCEACSQKK